MRSVRFQVVVSEDVFKKIEQEILETSTTKTKWFEKIVKEYFSKKEVSENKNKIINLAI